MLRVPGELIPLSLLRPCCNRDIKRFLVMLVSCSLLPLFLHLSVSRTAAHNGSIDRRQLTTSTEPAALLGLGLRHRSTANRLSQPKNRMLSARPRSATNQGNAVDARSDHGLCIIGHLPEDR